MCGPPIDITLDGSATVVTGCSIAPQYRWLDGAVVVRDWATDPTTIVRPATTTTYTFETRCDDCAGPCFAAASTSVTVDPDLLPPDLLNTLRAKRAGTDVDLTWGSRGPGAHLATLADHTRFHLGAMLAWGASSLHSHTSRKLLI